MAVARFNWKPIFWDSRASSPWWALTLPQFSFLIWLIGFRLTVLVGVFIVQVTHWDTLQSLSSDPIKNWELQTIGFWHIPSTYKWIAGLALALGLLTITHAWITEAYGRAKFLLTSTLILLIMVVNIHLVWIAGDLFVLAEYFDLDLPSK